MLYLGIDQHAKQLTISLRNDAGDVILNDKSPPSPNVCLEFFDEAATRRRAPDEATSPSSKSVASTTGCWNYCQSTAACRPSSSSPPRNQRSKPIAVTHTLLSELLWVNQHRLRGGQPVEVFAKSSCRPRSTPKSTYHAAPQRRRQVRTRATNRIKHILRRHNLQWQLPTKTFPTVKAIAWLSRQTSRLRPSRNGLASWRNSSDGLNECITRRSRSSLAAKAIESVELLRTIPGVGYYSALALTCRVGDPNRFPKGKSLAHYWGLTPGVNDSGDSTGRRGESPKPAARCSLDVGSNHTSRLRHDPVMKAWYKPIKNRRGSKIARVAVMRKLAVIIRNMLVQQADYFECRDAMIERRKQQWRQRQSKHKPIDAVSKETTSPKTGKRK